MLMLGLIKTIYQLPMANSVCWHSNMLRIGDRHVLGRALHFRLKVKGRKGG